MVETGRGPPSRSPATRRGAPARSHRPTRYGDTIRNIGPIVMRSEVMR